MNLFISDLTVVENGTLALRILSCGFLFYALGMVLVQGFNGSGDTTTPTKINLVSFWLLEIPLAYLLAIVLDLGLLGASISIVSAETFLALFAFYLFRKGKWKLREV
jgi:Na+-driven multidrug efflux pump